MSRASARPWPAAWLTLPNGSDRNAPDLRTLIARDGLEVARQMVAGLKPSHALDDLVLLPPIPNPEKLWCIGVNYKDRNAEYKDNSDLPKYPSLFVRNPSSVVGSGQPIEKPEDLRAARL